MKTSWRRYFRQLGAVCVVGTATAWTSAVSYAQVALDQAIDPVYNDGWQAGDDGGFGFGPWNFDGSYDAPPDTIHIINSTHPENQLGRAWAMSLNRKVLQRTVWPARDGCSMHR